MASISARNKQQRAISAVAVAAACLVACDKSPTGPTSREKSGDAVISGVQIAGPREVAPGQKIQLALIATLSNGTTRDVTSDANWISGNQQVASIAAPGGVTGGERGTVTIEARIGQLQAKKEIYVLPTGTYSLIGRLNDRTNRDVPVTDARVEVTTGTGTGLVASTNREGIFFLYGVAGDTTLHVTKEGYSQTTQTLSVVDHQYVTLDLAFLGKYPDVSGDYTLTITASSECGVGVGKGNLPQEIRVRSLPVTAEQNGLTLWVTPSGPQFGESRQGFYGRVDSGGGVVLTLRNPDDGQPIAERLSASNVLLIDGSAFSVDGVLAGELRLFEVTRSWVPIAWCSSPSHGFAMSRRSN